MSDTLTKKTLKGKPRGTNGGAKPKGDSPLTRRYGLGLTEEMDDSLRAYARQKGIAPMDYVRDVLGEHFRDLQCL